MYNFPFPLTIHTYYFTVVNIISTDSVTFFTVTDNDMDNIHRDNNNHEIANTNDNQGAENDDDMNSPQHIYYNIFLNIFIYV